MENYIQKPKRRIWKWIFIIFAALILLYTIYFAYQVLTIRRQILGGTYDFNQYGAEISGSGGANTSARTYDTLATPDDPAIGAASPQITIVEFADFACPFSRKAYTTIRSLANEFKDQVRFVFRDYPLDELHPLARLEAQAGYCANKQGRFWALHDKMFQNQDQLSRDYLFTLAEQAGVDMNTFRACLDSKEAQAEVETDWQDGSAAGVSGTPTWFINGVRVAGALPEDVFRKIIEGLIKK